MLIYGRGLFKTQSNISDEAFFVEIVNSFSAVSNSRKKAPSQIFDRVPSTPLYGRIFTRKLFTWQRKVFVVP